MYNTQSQKQSSFTMSIGDPEVERNKKNDNKGQEADLSPGMDY